MEQQVHVDYISFPEKNEYIHDWSRPHSFSGNWEMPTSPTNSMPIWQYTTATLSRVDAGPSSPYFVNSHDSPISPGPSSSTLPSPIVPSGFQHNQQPKYTPLPHNYEFSARAVDGYSASEQTVPAQPMQFGEANSVTSPEEEEEDSDTYNMWEPSRTYNSTSKTTTGPIRPSHRRTQSSSVTEMSSRNAKRAHTVVERNYRERLNDKIADLAQYLFETSSDSRTKPSKSLVMTRAKERLKQLEFRNTNLENEVTKLRQHIAILEHIVASSQGVERTTASLVTS